MNMQNTFKPYGYIYITINLINFKTYIGQHKATKHDKKYYGSGIAITRALRKYGRKNFINRVLCWCYSKHELDYTEVFYIDYYRKLGKANYNMADGGKGTLGIHLYGEKNGFYGKHHSEETRKRLSELALKRDYTNYRHKHYYISPDSKKRTSRLGWHPTEQNKITTARALMHGRKIKCQYCKKIFLSKYEYKKHLKAKHQKDIQKHNEMVMQKLKKRMHEFSKTAHECPYCHKIIHNKGNLTKHINIKHLNKKPHFKAYTCPCCNKIIHKKWNLIQHVKNKHKDKFEDYENLIK